MTNVVSKMAIPTPEDAIVPVMRTDTKGQPLNDQSVLAMLKEKYKTGYLYRGQTGRYFRPWPAEDKLDIAANSYMLYSLIPSDYRDLEDAIRVGRKHDSNVVLAFGNQVSAGRTALVLAGVNLLAAHDATGKIDTWCNGLPNHNTNYMTSLGQHVELSSQNVDLTASPEVAWWFATHTWSGFYQSGEGTIYCIKRDALEQAILELNQPTPNCAELIDISSGLHAVPDTLTPRPRAQQGSTLAGVEVGEFYLRLISLDGIMALVFHRDHVAHPIDTSQIKPANDGLFTFVSQARKGVWNTQWQDLLNLQCLKLGVTTIPSVADPRFRTAVFDGFNGLERLARGTP